MPDFSIESLNHIVHMGPSPVLAGKITIGQRFFYAVLHFLQLHFPQLSTTALAFSREAFLLS